ncbi:chaperonin 10-like protein [Piptocephalis cylindrospora]|uniref:Chaperonin 10-like protein n=1 Tax=Piptocephalis cylindrospora TaxID=1907219 RepID=A0A4P9XZN3_9FUNG|nr:chaperonin 10-like protein [Piptocephalis cylindrospora]|eukprot:RKP11844.1 chaperonin 10-like protein [Piptocephalis cylindrospora]
MDGTHGCIADLVVKEPMILGHESAGEVVALGSGVNTHQIGDHVAIEPGVPCRSCGLCKEGKYNICSDVRFAATPPIDGTLRYYYAHPADFCHIVPKNLSFDEAAMAEPLSVAIHANNRGGD